MDEGGWLSVIEPTGIWMNDYQWFVVDSPVGQGFHRRGIFCTYDVVPEGVLQAC